MRASIVSVGSEILRGALLDTNSNFLAQELQAIGVEVIRTTQVADDLNAIVEVLRSSIDTVDLIIVSGGLGPTEDDLTREAIIEVTGESPAVDPVVVEEIRERFLMRGSEMPERNEKQAWTIPSARVIPNPHGTAPGWLVELPHTVIVTLPGPPRENRPMWRERIRPWLVPRANTQSIVSRTIKTIGIGESAVADRIQELITLDWPVVATYAKRDGVHVSITASHPERALADAAVRAATESALDLLEPHVYGFGDDELAAAITQPLRAAGIRMSVWEAGTAGSLANLLLSDPEAQASIAEVRAWATPDDYPSSREFGIEQFARDASRTSGHSISAVVAARMEAVDGSVTDGSIEVALAHAGTIVSNSQDVRGSHDEIRRRSALFAAEFLWAEIRRAAGIHPDGVTSTPTSRT